VKGTADVAIAAQPGESAPYELAQVNVARLVAPLDSRELADFVANLDPVNAAADAAPGFRWRLEDEAGNATGLGGFEWDAAGSVGVIVNLSVWRDPDSLADFVFGDLHRAVLRRRRDWFQLMREAYLACWWVPSDHRPTVEEAEGRIRHLRRHGPTPEAFTLRERFDPPHAARRQTSDLP
jgi:hypothetical protein